MRGWSSESLGLAVFILKQLEVINDFKGGE